MNWDQERARLSAELDEIKASGKFKSWPALASEIGITKSQLHGFRFKPEYHGGGRSKVVEAIKAFVGQWNKEKNNNVHKENLSGLGIWSTLNRTSASDVHRNGNLYGRYTGFEFGPRRNETRAIELLIFEEEGLTKFCSGVIPRPSDGYFNDKNEQIYINWSRIEGVCCRDNQGLMLFDSSRLCANRFFYLRDVVASGMPNILKGVVFDLNGDYGGHENVAVYKIFLAAAGGAFSIPDKKELESRNWDGLVSWADKINYRKKNKIDWDEVLEKLRDKNISAICEMDWLGDSLLIWHQASEYWKDGMAGTLLRGMFPDSLRLFEEEN